MSDLLFLVHRLPYPPNKGDKVRSYHLLRHLAQRHNVYLATFVDDPADWEHVPTVRALCADAYIEGIDPDRRRVTSAATALLRGEALSVPYFRSRNMQRFVTTIAQDRNVRCAVCFSSPMAQYVPQGLRSIVDMVDVDSAKWTEYATRKAWPASVLYRREGRKLLGFERDVARRAHAVVFVTDRESALFCRSAPDTRARISTIRNGVDHEYFSPDRTYPNPYGRDELPIVFTGAMDYWPNAHAAMWFVRQVMPLLTEQAAIRFYIVGMNPDAAVRALGQQGAVTVTGRVDDIRPYLHHARVVVAPLQVARGVQNKVLEAMAMQKAVVTTAASADGLELVADDEIAVAGSAREFAQAVVDLCDPALGAAMGRRARARVISDFNWQRNFQSFDDLIDARPRHGSAPMAHVVSVAQTG